MTGKKRQKKKGRAVGLSLPDRLMPTLASLSLALLCLILAPLSKWLLDVGNAYLGVALGWFLLLLALGAGGLSAAVSRMVVSRLERGSRRAAVKVVNSAAAASFLGGLVLTLLLFSCADFLAEGVTGAALGAPALRALAFALLPLCVTGALTGGLDGFGFDNAAALVRLIVNLGWFFGSLLFSASWSAHGQKVGALLQNAQYGPAYAAFGSALALVLGAWLSCIAAALCWIYKRGSLRGLGGEPSEGGAGPELFRSLLFSRFFAMLLSLLVCAGMAARSALFLRLSSGAGDSVGITEFGVYAGKVFTALSLPLLAAFGFAARQLPGLRLGFERRNLKKSREKCMVMLRCTALFCVPLTVMLAVLAEPVVSTLFSAGELSLAAGLLRPASLCVLLFGLAAALGSALWSMEQERLAVAGLAAALLLQLVSLFLLLGLTEAGIYALVYGDLVLGAALCAFYLFLIRLRMRLRINWLRVFLAPCIGAALMAAVCAFLSFFLGQILPAPATFLICFVAGVLFYFVAETMLHGIGARELREFPGGEALLWLARRLRLL